MKSSINNTSIYSVVILIQQSVTILINMLCLFIFDTLSYGENVKSLAHHEVSLRLTVKQTRKRVKLKTILA